MVTFFKSLRRQNGFTLVELMVVVAIIGLLSAVAIPNFKKYQAKAKVSEAKLQLSAAYTAETAFFSDYNIYHHCLTYMGFDPGPETANRYYAMGFLTPIAINATALAAAVNSGLDTTATTGCPNTATAVAGSTTGVSDNAANWFAAGKGIGASIASTTAFLPATTIGDQSTAALMTFSVGAGGIISESFTTSANASKLRINQSKVLQSVMNGY